MVAMAYGVQRYQVEGGSAWLDETRYDVRVVAPQPVNDPEDLDPAALRLLITRLLGARFHLEIHVNSICQDPCGRLADARAAS